MAAGAAGRVFLLEGSVEVRVVVHGVVWWTWFVLFSSSGLVLVVGVFALVDLAEAFCFFYEGFLVCVA